jgi:hypothetical protein
MQGQQSQVFLNMTHNGADVDLDLPLSAYTHDLEQQQIKSQTGPKGTLSLSVTDKRDNKPIANAKLFFKGYSVEGMTNKKGIATVQLAEGTYDVSVMHPKYVMRVLKDIKVKRNTTGEQAIELVSADFVMDDYVVSAPAVEGSLAATFTELKESNVIGDALSSEQFSKTGDSSAAGALKRVTGITIVGGKYVYVRGLGERYSVVLLNDLYIPSPEPTKRVVPLDIFPSSVIQSMNIQKTYSADLPGTFAGGDVLITTKDIPKEDNYIKLGLSASFDDHTGDKAYSNSDNTKGLPQDIVNKSANFQELIKGYPSLGVPGYTEAELEAMNSAIANYRNYNKEQTSLKPGQKISLDFGQSFKTASGIKYGFVGNLYSATDTDYKEATKFNTHYEESTGALTSGERSEYQETSLSDKLGGLLSLGAKFMGQELKYTYLSLSDKEGTTLYSDKDGGPAGPGIDDAKTTYYQYVERTISAHQLSGQHHISFGNITNDYFNDIDIKWDAEQASATRYEPGTVEYTYEKTSNVTDFALNNEIWFLYSDLDDKLTNYRIDVTLPYTFNGRDNHTEVGFFSYTKERVLDNRRFKTQHALGNEVYQDIDAVFTQDNVNEGDIVLTSNYRPDDAYTAEQDLSAFYINQLVSVTSQLDVFAGLRIESSKQQLIDSQNGSAYEPLETSDALASISANYSLSDAHKLRLGFANTLSRPDFREFSPNRYKDPVTGDIVFGYPDLDYTKINNLDFKYEWYMSYDEMFSIGVFQKDFTNPVETIVNKDTNSQGGAKIITYRNALGATSQGIEVGIRKRLNFMGSFFDNIYASSNYALINSSVQLEANSTDTFIKELTTTDRPMQGQSSYVFNLNLGYDNPNTSRSAFLAYNEYGKRIVALGSFGAPDYYEYPFKKLDFVLNWQLNDTYDVQIKKIGYSFGVKVTNILDSDVEVRQGDAVYETHKPGVGVDVSFSLKY